MVPFPKQCGGVSGREGGNGTASFSDFGTRTDGRTSKVNGFWEGYYYLGLRKNRTVIVSSPVQVSDRELVSVWLLRCGALVALENVCALQAMTLRLTGL